MLILLLGALFVGGMMIAPKMGDFLKSNSAPPKTSTTATEKPTQIGQKLTCQQNGTNPVDGSKCKPNEVVATAKCKKPQTPTPTTPPKPSQPPDNAGCAQGDLGWSLLTDFGSPEAVLFLEHKPGSFPTPFSLDNVFPIPDDVHLSVSENVPPRFISRTYRPAWSAERESIPWHAV